MRSAALAAVLIASPLAVQASEACKFLNEGGQSVHWSGNSITVDPLYIPPFTCPLTPIPDSDAFTAKCGTWSMTVVIGYADNPDGAQAIVWNNVFYWRVCPKDHA